jgi:hypothetical protein
VFGQEHFDTRAGGFRRFNEDESVFMGQDHSGMLERVLRYTASVTCRCERFSASCRR